MMLALLRVQRCRLKVASTCIKEHQQIQWCAGTKNQAGSVFALLAFLLMQVNV